MQAGHACDTTRRRRREAGFTLVEALVGLVLAALVLTTTLALVQGLVRVRDWTSTHKDQDALAQAVLELIAADLRQVGAVQAVTPLRAESQPDGLHLELVGFSSLADAFPAGLCRSSYHYDAQAKRLVRHESSLRTRPTSDAQLQQKAEDRESRVSVDHIERLSLAFWDGRRWLDHWPPRGGGGVLPQAARIELRLLVDKRPLEATRLVMIEVQQ